MHVWLTISSWTTFSSGVLSSVKFHCRVLSPPPCQELKHSSGCACLSSMAVFGWVLSFVHTSIFPTVFASWLLGASQNGYMKTQKIQCQKFYTTVNWNLGRNQIWSKWVENLSPEAKHFMYLNRFLRAFEACRCAASTSSITWSSNVLLELILKDRTKALTGLTASSVEFVICYPFLYYFTTHQELT